MATEPDGTGDTERRGEQDAASGAARAEDGSSPVGSEDRQRSLQSLFIDVTGTEELVETRSDTTSARQVEDSDESTVSEYVTAVAKNDGLSDAVPEPGVESGLD